MKKSLSYIIAIAAVFLLGNTIVNATSYWNDYFTKLGPITGMDCHHNAVYIDYRGGCGNVLGYEFAPDIYSKGELFQASKVEAKSNDENIITTEVKAYDYSKEKENYENYIDWYKQISQEEFDKYFKIRYGKEEIDEKLLEYNKENPNATKTFDEFVKEFFVCYPTDENYSEESYYEKGAKTSWWEINGYKTEPKTWWEAYNFKSEPTSTFEVLTYIHDLGDVTITITVDGKTENRNWDMEAVGFTNDNASGLVELINNYEKYQKQGVLSKYKDEDEIEYDFRYQTSENDNLTEIINSLKGKDLTIKFETGWDINSYYYLNGKDILNTVNDGFNYHHNISMETSVNKENIENLMKAQEKLFIDFNYHGNLPAPYKLTVNFKKYLKNLYTNNYCGKEEKNYYKCFNDNEEKITNDVENYIKEKTFTLLYYNQSTNEMEEVYKNLKADENGNIELTFDHFSTYVVVGDQDYKILEKVEVPKTIDTLPTILTILAISTIGVICSYTYAKKRM